LFSLTFIVYISYIYANIYELIIVNSIYISIIYNYIKIILFILLVYYLYNTCNIIFIILRARARVKYKYMFLNQSVAFNFFLIS